MDVDTFATLPSCRPGGCAHLCTDEGLRAADSAYRRQLLTRARRVVVDPDLAEEAVQEALVRAWRSCASFDPHGGPLLAWLLAITRNVAIDMAKARSRRPPVGAGLSTDDNVAPAGLGHEDLVALRSQLHHALESIGGAHRHAIVETVLRGRSHAEVAVDLGIPAGTIRSRVHYALRQLRILLEAAEGVAA
jgi:RNA polymerase sigma-70 factor (ECF subfamily)